jgi:phage portal protein BeeE
MWFSNAFSGGDSTNSEAGTWLGSTAGSWGVKSDAGEVVSPTSAFAIPAVQRCVMILAEAVSRLPIKMYQALPDGGFDEVKDHALHPLLQVSPASFLTPQTFNEFKQISLGLRGNAYAVKMYDNRGRLISLMPINPDRVIVLINPENHLPYYRVTMSIMCVGVIVKIPLLGYHRLCCMPTHWAFLWQPSVMRGKRLKMAPI